MSMWQTLKQRNRSQAEQLASLLEEADAVVVGIGAGMSAADGFTYIGPRFENVFPDFIAKYGFLDMLQASLFHFESIEEYWAFQSRFVALNYLDQPVGLSYVRLKELLADKPYHIITTNADNAFEAANYDMDKVFHIQGEYGLWQCSRHCHDQTYRDDSLIRRMIAEQADMKIPYELIPRCPLCDAPFEINKRNAEKGMVESPDFFAQKARYDAFLDHYQTGKILYLEIGVGFITPQFIKLPFQTRVQQNPQALFVSLNQKHYRLPLPIRERSLTLSQDIAQLLEDTHTIYFKGEKRVPY
ncbi:SIR2 family NAD-dependent protein deacylase [Streptococcus ruminantium]|uniref:SIR2 family NAD-dependent protein deacylase n=1 Tax=Streptococcus ruminantium TaxID=1917441 RepID=UPI0012DF6944|nr:NAD-dependent deacetylase [Streptococcus ruminantium]